MSPFNHNFLPHGYCLNWEPLLLWIYSISNGLIALSYFSIPVLLVYFVHKRRDLCFPSIFICFSLFIFACGAGHILHIFSLWKPLYNLQMIVDGVTGVGSAITAFMLWRLLPKALTIPSPTQFKQLNSDLNWEIAQRKHNEQKLREAQSTLEQRVQERTGQLKQTNLLLQESQNRLHTIISNVHAVIWTLDENKKLTFISDYIAQLLGYSPTPFRNYKSCLQMIHRDDRYKMLRVLLKALRWQRHSHFKCRAKHQDDSWRWICVSIAPVKLKDDVIQIVGVMHDAHQDYLQQEKIRQMNRQLDRRIKQAIEKNHRQEKLIASQARFAAMGEMVSNIAHQWRQPLNSLSLIIEDIHEAYRHQELDEAYMQEAETKSMKLIDTMSTTIDFFESRLSGQSEKTVFQLNDVINDSVALVKDHLASKGIAIRAEIDSAVAIQGLPEELSQILQNIIANARDAILANGASVKEIDISLSKTPSQAILEICDSGGGIDPNILDRIFDPFFSTKKPGRGIGLYMVKQLIEESLGGRIEAGNWRTGTKITLSLPLAPTDSAVNIPSTNQVIEESNESSDR